MNGNRLAAAAILLALCLGGCRGPEKPSSVAIPPSQEPVREDPQAGGKEDGAPVPKGNTARVIASLREPGDIDRLLPVVTVGDMRVTVQDCLETFPKLVTHGGKSGLAEEVALEGIVARTLFYLDARDRGIRLNLLERAWEKSIRDQWLGFHYRNRVGETFLATEKEIDARLPKSLETARVSEITVGTREEAEKVLARLASGEKFGDVARAASISPSAAGGGKVSLEFVRSRASLWRDEIQERFFTVPPGTVIGEPVETEMGYAVFRVDERKRMSEEAVRGFRRSVAADIYNERMQEFKEAVEKRYPLVVDEPKLEAASADPVGSLDVVVARVGENRISFGEVVADFDRARSLPMAGDPALDGSINYLRKLYHLYAMREEAVRNGMLDDPLVKMNYRIFGKELLVERYREKIMAKISVSDEEIEREYRKYRKEIEGLTVYRFGMGEFPTKDFAAQVADRVRKGEDLSDLFPKVFHGQRPMETLPEVSYTDESLPPVFRGKVSSMKPGRTYGPLEHAGPGEAPTYYVVKYLSKGPAVADPLSLARGRMRQRVQAEKFALEYSRIVIEKRKTVDVATDRELFRYVFTQWKEGALS